MRFICARRCTRLDFISALELFLGPIAARSTWSAGGAPSACGMICLYRSDYGPAEPGFDPFAGTGAGGDAAWARDLATARNAGQLAAIQRQLARGEPTIWCDEGYSWVAAPIVEHGFPVVVIAVVACYALIRFPAFVAKRRRPLATARDSAAPGQARSG
jgi:hypothetical protein